MTRCHCLKHMANLLASNIGAIPTIRDVVDVILKIVSDLRAPPTLYTLFKSLRDFHNSKLRSIHYEPAFKKFDQYDRVLSS